MHLRKCFAPYDSFFETNILLKSISSILNSFLFLLKINFVDLFIIENYVLSTHSYIM